VSSKNAAKKEGNILTLRKIVLSYIGKKGGIEKEDKQL